MVLHVKPQLSRVATGDVHSVARSTFWVMRNWESASHNQITPNRTQKYLPVWVGYQTFFAGQREVFPQAGEGKQGDGQAPGVPAAARR